MAAAALRPPEMVPPEHYTIEATPALPVLEDVARSMPDVAASTPVVIDCLLSTIDGYPVFCLDRAADAQAKTTPTLPDTDRWPSVAAGPNGWAVRLAYAYRLSLDAAATKRAAKSLSTAWVRLAVPPPAATGAAALSADQRIDKSELSIIAGGDAEHYPAFAKLMGLNYSLSMDCVVRADLRLSCRNGALVSRNEAGAMTTPLSAVQEQQLFDAAYARMSGFRVSRLTKSGQSPVGRWTTLSINYRLAE